MSSAGVMVKLADPPRPSPGALPGGAHLACSRSRVGHGGTPIVREQFRRAKRGVPDLTRPSVGGPPVRLRTCRELLAMDRNVSGGALHKVSSLVDPTAAFMRHPANGVSPKNLGDLFVFVKLTAWLRGGPSRSRLWPWALNPWRTGHGREGSWRSWQRRGPPWPHRCP